MPDNPAETPLETPLRTPEHGHGALKTGNPGNKGGGRTKDEFKARMRELASDDLALAYFAECVRGDHGPKAHASAMAFAAEHGYGKPVEALELTGKDGGPIVVAWQFGSGREIKY